MTNPHLELPPPSSPQYPQVPSELPSYTAYGYPVPPAYYGTIPPPSTTTTQPMPSNPVTQSISTLKADAALVQCPHCRQLVYTVLDYDAGLCTGLSVVGLFMAGFHAGGCLIPFLFPWTKDVTHHCPSCKQKIATFTRLERDTRLN